MNQPLAATAVDALVACLSRPRATHQVTLELDMRSRHGGTVFSVDAHFYLIGQHRPATETSPADYAVPIVTRCVISCGEWQALADFHTLDSTLQNAINEEIADHLGWQS